MSPFESIIRLVVLTHATQAEMLRSRGFLEPSEEQPYFSLQESRRDALARIRGVLQHEGILSDYVVLEVEFTSVGLCTLWPCELKHEQGRYRLFGTLYGKLMDVDDRVLYRVFI